MKKLVLKMMAVCAGALIVSCGSGKNMLSVSSLDGEWNITEVDGQKISTERMPFIGFDVAQKRIYGNSYVFYTKASQSFNFRKKRK